MPVPPRGRVREQIGGGGKVRGVKTRAEAIEGRDRRVKC